MNAEDELFREDYEYFDIDKIGLPELFPLFVLNRTSND